MPALIVLAFSKFFQHYLEVVCLQKLGMTTLNHKIIFTSSNANDALLPSLAAENVSETKKISINITAECERADV